MKRISSLMLCTLAATAALATAATAGETIGRGGGQYRVGDANPLQGKSYCAYSGLNDEYYINDITGAARTQSYGQDVRTGYADPRPWANPGGIAGIWYCNPNNAEALPE